MKKTILAAGCGLLLAAVVAPASAQGPSLNVTLGATSAYVWRGVTLADQPSLQGDVNLTIPAGRGAFTAGAWGTAEISPDTSRFSSLTDFESGFGEVDLYAQYSHPVGPASLSVGMTSLNFPEISEWNTLEVFGMVAVPDAPLAPSLVVRKDIDAVGGAYAELNLSQGVQVWPNHTLVFGAQVAASTGQADDGDLAWYADEGITHVAVSAALNFSRGGFSITPLVNLTYGVDDFAKVDDDEARFGAGITISRSLPLSR